MARTPILRKASGWNAKARIYFSFSIFILSVEFSGQLFVARLRFWHCSFSLFKHGQAAIKIKAFEGYFPELSMKHLFSFDQA